MITRDNVIFDAISYQITVTQLSVLGALRECEDDRDVQVARRLSVLFICYNFLMNVPNKTIFGMQLKIDNQN